MPVVFCNKTMKPPVLVSGVQRWGMFCELNFVLGRGGSKFPKRQMCLSFCFFLFFDLSIQAFFDFSSIPGL